MADPIWKWPGTRAGDHDRTCSVSLRGENLLWATDELDEDEDAEPSVRQPVRDFREYGPPESRQYLAAPAAVLEAICVAIGLTEPSWLAPLPEPVARWFAAAEEGNVRKLEALLAEGVDVNALDTTRRNALWRTLHGRGKLGATQWLLEHGADVNRRDRYGRTLLMNAALLRDAERVELYLHHCADKAVRDADGQTAFLTAIDSRADGLVCDRLANGGEEEWRQALHVAAAASNVSWLEWQSHRVEADAVDLNFRQKPGPRTALQACLQGWKPHPAVVRWLAEHGADLTVVEAQDGSTILHHAARQQLSWLVEPAVRAGVAVDARDAEGQTALALALEGQEAPALVRALMEAGANPALDVPGPGGTESVQAKAARLGLVWSAFLMGGPENLRLWSGLCAHAEARAATGDVCWLEFPAEWCVGPTEGLNDRLQRAAMEVVGSEVAVRALPRAESHLQPWGKPGGKLWAVLPSGRNEPVERFREQRPVVLMSCPEALTEASLEGIEREWTWPAPPWATQHQPYKLRLRRGELRWTAHNLEVRRSAARFRVEGVPMGMHDSMPREVVDELCALLGDGRREWEVLASVRARQQRVEAWLAAQPELAAEASVSPPPPGASGLVCYARVQIEDRFNTPTGAGSDSEWTSWLEFPAEWSQAPLASLRQWVKSALQRAYDAMNGRIADDPEGGSYVLRDCHAVVLPLAEAARQPWREPGKILYVVPDAEAAPTSLGASAPLRPVERMADPSALPESGESSEPEG